MKALIISDDTKVINSLKFFLEDKGFDTIVYRWLLKAMDNVEEIRPDCIIVSSSEYPRHWKTLVQFAKSGIGGDRIGIFLYEPTPMSEEDLEKVNLLGVNGMFTDFTPEELANLDFMLNDFYGFESEKIESPVETENESVTETETVENNIEEASPIIEEEALISVDSITETAELPETEASGTGYFMMNHPVTNAFISGNYFDFSNNTMTCKVNASYDFNIGADVKYFSYMYKGECNSCKATITNVMDINNEKLLVIDLHEQYENL